MPHPVYGDTFVGAEKAMIEADKTVRRAEALHTSALSLSMAPLEARAASISQSSERALRSAETLLSAEEMLEESRNSMERTKNFFERLFPPELCNSYKWRAMSLRDTESDLRALANEADGHIQRRVSAYTRRAEPRKEARRVAYGMTSEFLVDLENEDASTTLAEAAGVDVNTPEMLAILQAIKEDSLMDVDEMLDAVREEHRNNN